ncbi:hypothetical protein [Roseateles sp.]|uniref:hypothetical protein n=1 Tax=Roseateles sp. TaxID=1971397 RepID=UPI00286C4447|nr:hypothetical protein [Roseateles sp.]
MCRLREAWRRGWLVAEDLRLDEFLDEFSPYYPGRLDCAPEPATLRLAGSFPLADSAAACPVGSASCRGLQIFEADGALFFERRLASSWKLQPMSPSINMMLSLPPSLKNRALCLAQQTSVACQRYEIASGQGLARIAAQSSLLVAADARLTGGRLI